MPTAPVAIESKEQRQAVADVEASDRRARERRFTWSVRLVVLACGVPVALLGLTAGQLMWRQDQNADGVALTALINRMQQRVADCVSRDAAPLPGLMRVTVQNLEQPLVECAGGCPEACVQAALVPLVRQSAPGFTHVIELDFGADRLLAIDEVVRAARRGAAAGVVLVSASVDGTGYDVACRAGGESVRVTASWRVARDLPAVRHAAKLMQPRCTR